MFFLEENRIGPGKITVEEVLPFNQTVKVSVRISGFIRFCSGKICLRRIGAPTAKAV